MPWYKNKKALGSIAVIFAVALLLNEVKLLGRDAVMNTHVLEAMAWSEGRVNLPERTWDTAYYSGRVVSYFPPMFTILSWALLSTVGRVPFASLLELSAAVIVLAFGLMYRRTGSVVWGGVLACGLVFGTSMWSIIERALRSTSPYECNHLLALIGTLIFLFEYFGRRRTWLMGIGMIVAFWSRQLSLALALPLMYAAWSRPSGKARSLGLGTACVSIGIAVGLMLTLNTLKFGHPLDSGYMHNYAAGGGQEERDDAFARDAREYGIFSLHYLSTNLYYANIGLPRLHKIEIAGKPEYHLKSNIFGSGIWWTSPVLIWLFFELGTIVRDRDRLMLLIAAFAMYAALMCFHGTGWVQRGFNRYSLDYLPILFALIAPAAVRGKRRWVTLGMVAWSTLYFGILIRPHVG